ncbi:hypothetical protein NE857_21540 [Nocardiopsis exhalans]|uniref:Uncharacterized protein n=1 Tax=Nocardiopsis exhalans TaxID=163604 RepID=A0ABY5D2C5_9ACTN|nr:hypothetical protein [Nocardiopsis exhalans]USY17901.1 hypothetical protein NE857_21540 [Nocardiopsis exhalans]
MSEHPTSGLVTVCATCGERITTIEWKQWGETSWEWRHGSDADHEAVPAPADLSEAVRRCDFCSGLNPQWVFVTAQMFETLHLFEDSSIVERDDGAWSACVACKRLVVKRDLDRLVHRAMILIRRSFPDQDEDFYANAKKELRNFHGAFLTAGPGEPKRIDS